MAYLDNVKQGAIEGWRTHQILPSITGAQAAIESGWGTSNLSKPPHNNNFGIKAPAGYTGSNVVTMPTREYLNGQWITVNAQFLTYPSLRDSIKDHAAFFTNSEWRKNNYKAVVGERDYKKAAWALKNAGYATDPSYATKLINLIEQHNLVAWDQEAFSGANSSSSNVLTVPPVQTDSTIVATSKNSKTVGGQLTNAARQAIGRIGITVIGDSLGVGTKPQLSKHFPNSNFDVIGSRQWTHSQEELNATEAFNKMRLAGTLKDVLVFILGTNRGVTNDEIDNIVKLSGNRKILLVDTASEVTHRTSVSNAYQSASIRHTNVFYVNWSAFAIPLISGLYSADGVNGARIHMTPGGYASHADYIAMGIYEAYHGNFESRTTATDKTVDYVTIKNVELLEDGTLKYEMMKPVGNIIPKPGDTVRVEKITLTENIGVKGLYSPKGDSMIYNKEANDRWGFKSNGPQAQFIEGVFEDTSATSSADLVKAAAKELVKHSEPAAQYKVKLSDIPFEVSIGDTGVFIDHEFNPPLYLKARVLEIGTSETNPSAGYVTIGNVVELFPQDRNDVQRLRDEIQRSRVELMKEWREGGPISLTIESLNGSFLNEKENETTIVVRAFQNDVEVTDWFSKFKWSRLSDNLALDAVYNDVLKVHQSGALTVRYEDIVNQNSNFSCTVYDDADEIVGTVIIKLEKLIMGKSAYELAKSTGFQGTLEEWIESLRGRDGSNGLPGAKGEDGRTNYTHIAYANSSNGTVGFSTTDSLNKSYIGVYVDFIQTDSTNPARYRWTLVKGPQGPKGDPGVQGLQGPKGDQGLPGEKGADGKTQYTHIAYATGMKFPVNLATTQEMTIELGTSKKKILLASDLVVGQQYTISLKSACIPHMNSTIQLNLALKKLAPSQLKMTSNSGKYPVINRQLTSTSTSINTVYHDTYSITAETDWETGSKVESIIGAKTVTVSMNWKQVADGNEHNWTGEWSDNPELILDGGVN